MLNLTDPGLQKFNCQHLAALNRACNDTSHNYIVNTLKTIFGNIY